MSEGPPFLGLVFSVAAFLFVLQVLLFPRGSFLTFAGGVAAVSAIALFLPESAKASLALTTFGLSVGLLLLSHLVPSGRVRWLLFNTYVFVRRARRARRHLRPVRTLHPQMAEPIAALETCGFERIAMGRDPFMATHAIMFRTGDSTIARVVRPHALAFARLRGYPEIVLGLVSVLEDRRGILSTESMGVGVWDRELCQVFPGATPEELAVHHEQARRFLEERDLGFASFPREEVMDVDGWIWRESISAMLAVPPSELGRRLADAARGDFRDLGPVWQNPSMLDRVTVLRG